MTPEIYKRICRWNEARFPQEYDHFRNMTMLFEELKEWYEAKTDTDALDALCDIIFVGCGCMWKLKATEEELDNKRMVDHMQHLVKTSGFSAITLVAALIYEANIREDRISLINLFKGLMISAEMQMSFMGLNANQCNKAMHIVCDSNDTKLVKKIGADEKAGKGITYVPPESKLARLLGGK